MVQQLLLLSLSNIDKFIFEIVQDDIGMKIRLLGDPKIIELR